MTLKRLFLSFEKKYGWRVEIVVMGILTFGKYFNIIFIIVNWKKSTKHSPNHEMKMSSLFFSLMKIIRYGLIPLLIDSCSYPLI